MDFSFTPEQELLRKSVREFAEAVLAPKVEAMEKSREIPIDAYRQMGKLGLLGVTAPREYGGADMGHVARMIILEEIGRVSAAAAMALQVFHLGIAPIASSGTEEQKKKYLPPLMMGEKFATAAITESCGGSDPLSLKTTAKKEGDNWIINGRKCFITNAKLADVQTFIARSGDGPRDITAFIVEKGTPGFRDGRQEDKFGFKGCDTGEVIFENLVLPQSSVLGKEGEGAKVALASIGNVGRAGMAGVALGILNGCFEDAQRYAKERQLYGKPIGDLQAIQWLLTDIYMDLETSRLLTYRAATLLDQGVRCDNEIAMAKFYSTEAAVRSAKKAIDIHGGYGLMEEFAVQRYARDAQMCIPSAGTSEIMRVVMARNLLR